jgi:hypothetical protein
MDRSLMHAAHVSVRIEQKTGLTQFSLLKHPHLPTRTTIASVPDVQILECYL